VPEAPAQPQLLILAEPLLGEGLLQVLQSYRCCSQAETLSGAPQLVLWSLSAELPAATLMRELQQLRERWQPAPLLLLLPPQTRYPTAWLLELPVEGLLLQGEAEQLRDAVQTLLAGGRVVELPASLEGTANGQDEALGLGQWLLRSGLAQIESERQRCLRSLESGHSAAWGHLMLQGRLRELAMARRLLLWLWGPLSMAFPAPPQRAGAETGGLGTSISLRERTALGVWQTIETRLRTTIRGDLSNQSGQLLALEGLAADQRRALLEALLGQLGLLISRLRQDHQRGPELLERWDGMQEDLRRLALRQMAGDYVQLPQEGRLLPVADSLIAAANLKRLDPESPSPLPMLTALVQAQPLLVEGRLLAPDEPQALLHLEALISNWLVRTAELLSAEVLNCCSGWPELRRYLLRPDLLATRNLERLRNQLNSQQRWLEWIERPMDLYESRRHLLHLQGGTIRPVRIIEPRDRELKQLGWLQQLVTLSLEARDALAPQVQAFLRRLGDLVVVVLTKVIGRAIGLIGRGILQGMGRSLSGG
jgi:DNA-binding NarL/FixJ family response regulator